MVSRALSGSHARTICSTRVRPPALCKTLARLDLRRVPFPAARTITAKSWLDIVSSPFCESRGELGKDGWVGRLVGRDGCAGGDGPKGGVGQQSANQLRVQGVPRFVGL